MARTANFSSDDGEDPDSTAYNTTVMTEATGQRVAHASPSPTVSFGSDKENRSVNAGRDGKRRTTGLSEATPGSDRSSSRPSLKRKLADRDTPLNATQRLHQQELAEAGDDELYDPDQSMGERRALRKDYRDLSKDLTGRLLRRTICIGFSNMLP